MKTHSRSARPGFSLIELMAVITIIVILAGLVVTGMGFVNERQAKEKARIQIGLLENVIEDYKLDNGVYPPGNSADGTGGSTELFNALYYEGFSDTSGATTIYLPELDPEMNKQGWTSGSPSATVKIIDPWGNEYRYRSGKSSSGEVNDSAQNPDFDLWSVGKDGKTSSEISSKVNNDDIGNF
jgi:general secretion pathway protein G